jgi:hypothetical protein
MGSAVSCQLAILEKWTNRTGPHWRFVSDGLPILIPNTPASYVSPNGRDQRLGLRSRCPGPLSRRERRTRAMPIRSATRTDSSRRELGPRQ